MTALLAALAVFDRHRISRLVLALMAGAPLLLAAPVYAQPGGTITGRVADETGGVLPGVTVDLHSYGMETTAVTDGTGDYRIDNVPPGPVDLTFKLINFTVVRRTASICTRHCRAPCASHCNCPFDGFLRSSMRLGRTGLTEGG